MDLTIDKKSALEALRHVRSSRMPLPDDRVDLPAPSPAPAKTWTKRNIAKTLSNLVGPFSAERPLHVAVPSKAARLRVIGTTSAIHSAGLPDGSFVPLGDGILIPSPELLFVEAGSFMSPLSHLMLGLELCGCFCRSAENPRDGKTTYQVEPVTSSLSIRRFLSACKHVGGTRQASRLAPLLMDNAWSPMECLIASIVCLDATDLGYGMAPLFLNPRVETPDGLAGISEKGSRVPDIMFGGTHVGLNYDGSMHFDLGLIADAAARSAVSPDDATLAQDLDAAVRSTRDKIVDGKRRDRDLWVSGLTVLPVTSEDLYQEGGLDVVVGQVIEAIERETGKRLEAQRNVLRQKALSKGRQRLLWSVLPGARGRRIAQELEAKAEARANAAPVIIDEVIEL
jgi:hypothetical protein